MITASNWSHSIARHISIALHARPIIEHFQNPHRRAAKHRHCHHYHHHHHHHRHRHRCCRTFRVVTLKACRKRDGNRGPQPRPQENNLIGVRDLVSELEEVNGLRGGEAEDADANPVQDGAELELGAVEFQERRERRQHWVRHIR